MKKVNESNTREWSVKKDERKSQFLLDVVKRRFDKQLQSGRLAEFLEFLVSEDHYRYSVHLLRYVETYSRICHNDISGVIVETGDRSPILDFIARTHSNCECYHTESDLRIEIDAESAFADVVFSFEVFEHIKDKPETEFSEVVLFQESGARCYSNEISRILKGNGDLYVTTPNPTSSFVLQRVLNGEAPMVFRPHVREYTKEEIIGIFNDFELRRYDTMYNFFLLNDGKHRLAEVFELTGASASERGDDHFFHFRK